MSEAEFKEGTFKWGPFMVIVSIDAGRWHMSISHPKRDLTYMELKRARYKFLPSDKPIAMVFPPPSTFVNIHYYTFHFWELRDDFPEWTRPLTEDEQRLQEEVRKHYYGSAKQ